MTNEDNQSATNKRENKTNVCHKFSKISLTVTTFLETIFYRWGLVISTWPRLTILFSLLVSGGLTSGMMFWYQEMDQEVLWTPYNSPFNEQKAWIADTFPRDRRYENLILESENILTADTVRYFAELDTRIRNYESPDNLTFTDLCLRYPDTSKGNLSDCITFGIFSIFLSFPLANLTDEAVQETISMLYSRQPDVVDQFISGIQFSMDGSGTIRGARAVMNIWLLADNATSQVDVNQDALKWELGFIDVVIENPPDNKPEGLKIYGLAERSYDDEIMDVVYSNFSIFIIGFGLLFIYILFVLGEMNWIEQRALLSIAGMVVVGLSLGASIGLGFYLNISFNDMCPIIPFLLLGIGVDDMFVIVQSLDNLESRPGESSEERVARAMQHAGVSILVTSITDAATFFIGSTSSMPILRGFCYFCCLGVIFLFVFASTFFVAFLLLDERRQARQRAARPLWSPPSWTRAKPGAFIFRHWVSPLVVWTPAVVTISIITLGLAAAGVWGLVNIESDYDSIWYMRHDSYPYQYFKALGEQFQGQGERVDVYLGELNYETNRGELEKICPLLKKNEYIREDSIQFWYKDFLTFYDNQTQTNESQSFMSYVGHFLTLNNNYLQDVKINISYSDEDLPEKLEMGDFHITASRATFQHIALENTTIRNKAMGDVKDAMDSISFENINFPIHPIPYTMMYVQWEANIIISKQLIRNLAFAFATIALVNLILIADLVVSLLVFLCVVLTILDIVGGLYFMGLTIEIVTSVQLILSVGLALDYSAHIGVTYIVTRGRERRQRTQDTLNNIGTAVFNGGFSTFLAFVLVAFSDSYVFLTFFKMFSCVVLFGLFHGLFFLPAMLSIMGPSSEFGKDDNMEQQIHGEDNKATSKL